MKVTLSVIKADVGSIGGHTMPSEKMLQAVRTIMESVKGDDGSILSQSLLIDGLVTHTGDDIALIMSHRHGVGAKNVHKFAWDCFLRATEIAEEQGLYGAGQDLLADAPSGNIKGAGPGVAEIEFERDPKSKNRPAEAFLIFAIDKASPGAFNYPLGEVFTNPAFDSGIILSPKIGVGFSMTIMDMDYRDGDRVITLNAPEDNWKIAALLQNPDRFAIESIHSRFTPEEQVVSASTTRLHNIAGKYTGKDDPVAIVRTQGIFPAPEEVISPYTFGHFITGDARGSHIMPLFPKAINSPVTGSYCLPIVSCIGFSMNHKGMFSRTMVDFFGETEWDWPRLEIARKAYEWRRQGHFGPTMASQAELAYTGIVEALKELDPKFEIRK